MRHRTTAFSSRHVESDSIHPSRRLLSNRSLSIKPSIDSRIGFRCRASARYSSFLPVAGCTSKTTTNMRLSLSATRWQLQNINRDSAIYLRPSSEGGIVMRITAALILSLTPLCAQWIDYPTPGMPRTTDGKPNLSAPAPRTPDGKPDLSGLWRIGVSRGYGASITTDLAPGDIQLWAQALSHQRLEEFG